MSNSEKAAASLREAIIDAINAAEDFRANGMGAFAAEADALRVAAERQLAAL